MKRSGAQQIMLVKDETKKFWITTNKQIIIGIHRQVPVDWR